MKYQQNGFTLVELAIALMVIGLLIGGVLKGQELIENARITRVVKDLHDYDTAITIFDSIYGELPGNMTNPSILPNCTTPPCSTIRSGNRIDINRISFWFHLNRAGLIGAIDENASNTYGLSPKNSLGGYFVLGRHSQLHPLAETPEYPRINAFLIGDETTLIDNMRNCVRIAQIDQKMDDGKPLTGQAYLFITHGGARCYDAATLDYTNDRTATSYFMVSLPSLN